MDVRIKTPVYFLLTGLIVLAGFVFELRHSVYLDAAYWVMWLLLYVARARTVGSAPATALAVVALSVGMPLIAAYVFPEAYLRVVLHNRTYPASQPDIALTYGLAVGALVLQIVYTLYLGLVGTPAIRGIAARLARFRA